MIYFTPSCSVHHCPALWVLLFGSLISGWCIFPSSQILVNLKALSRMCLSLLSPSFSSLLCLDLVSFFQAQGWKLITTFVSYAEQQQRSRDPRTIEGAQLNHLAQWSRTKSYEALKCGGISPLFAFPPSSCIMLINLLWIHRGGTHNRAPSSSFPHLWRRFFFWRRAKSTFYQTIFLCISWEPQQRGWQERDRKGAASGLRPPLHVQRIKSGCTIAFN